MVAVDISQVYSRTSRARRSPKAVSEIPDQLEVLLAADTGAACDNYPGRLEVDLLFLMVLANYFEGKIDLRYLRFYLYHLGFAAGVGLGHRHHTFANRRHLRPAVIVDDRRDDIAAKCRTYLEQQVLICCGGLLDLVVADLEVGAVRRQPGLDGAGHPRSKVPAARCGPVEHDLRMILVNKLVNDLRV